MAAKELSSLSFYEQLVPLDDYHQLTSPQFFQPCPEDWVVFVTDVENSTQAIREGRYKEVNTVGASSIVAVANALQRAEVPYVFGGDGATFIVPQDLAGDVAKALHGTAEVSKVSFQLHLRVGKISVKELRELGTDVQIAKIHITPELHQAAFRGGGLMLAEKLIKEADSPYLLRQQASPYDADLTGLECRWNEIKNDRGEVLSLIIQAHDADQNADDIYREVLQKIDEIMGQKAERNPLQYDNMFMTSEIRKLAMGDRFRHPLSWEWVRKIRLAWQSFETRVASVVKRRRMKLLWVDWGYYFQKIVEYSDFQKFDEMIRMVVASSPERREKLLHYLDEKSLEGSIRYGSFVSPAALLTCIVFDVKDRHFHLVDGSDGGYAMAAKELKSKFISR